MDVGIRELGAVLAKITGLSSSCLDNVASVGTQLLLFTRFSGRLQARAFRGLPLFMSASSICIVLLRCGYQWISLALSCTKECRPRCSLWRNKGVTLSTTKHVKKQ